MKSKTFAVLLSVVIATYRRPQLLARCLEGLQKQTLPKQLFEVVVVSDGPDPRIRHWHRAEADYGFPLKVLQLPTHCGPAAARNLGWRSANGALIVFTDDDCIAAPNFLAAYYHYYAVHGIIAVALSGLTYVPLTSVENKRLTDFAANLKGLESASFITANCAVLKRDLVRIGGFDDTYCMAWREDSDLEFNLQKHGIKILIQPYAFVYHPLRVVRWGVSLREQKKSMFNALLFKKFPQKYKIEVQTGPPVIYYTYGIITVLLIFGLFDVFSRLFELLILICWWTVYGRLFFKRWQPVGKNCPNAQEIIATTVVLPFLSIYWRIYGAIRFKVFFF